MSGVSSSRIISVCVCVYVCVRACEVIILCAVHWLLPSLLLESVPLSGLVWAKHQSSSILQKNKPQKNQCESDLCQIVFAINSLVSNKIFHLLPPAIYLIFLFEFLANTTCLCKCVHSECVVYACVSQSSRQVGRLTKVKMLYSMRQEKHTKME